MKSLQNHRNRRSEIFIFVDESLELSASRKHDIRLRPWIAQVSDSDTKYPWRIEGYTNSPENG